MAVSFCVVAVVWLIAGCIFGTQGFSVLAAIHAVPFLMLLERSFDHPIDGIYVVFVLVSVFFSIGLLAGVDYFFLQRMIKGKRLIEWVLMVITYLGFLGIVFLV